MPTPRSALALLVACLGLALGCASTPTGTGTTSSGGNGSASGTSGSGGGTGGGGMTCSGPYGTIVCPVGDYCTTNEPTCFPIVMTSGGSSSGGHGSSSGGSSSGGSTGALYVDGGECANNRPNLLTGQTDQGGNCVTGCALDLSCIDGGCWLEGEKSPVQVVLSWDYDEDLDLHVIEPQQGGPSHEVGPNGGDGGPGCEIWWGNQGPGQKDVGDCSPAGALSQDAESDCDDDGINIEQVTYPTTTPPPYGLYTVRVDFFQFCGGNYPAIPYTVQIRVGQEISIYCGSFTPEQDDQGVEGSGRNIATFWVDPPDAGCSSFGTSAVGATCSSACDCASETCEAKKPGDGGSAPVCYGGPGTGTYAPCAANDECTSLTCGRGSCCGAPDGGAAGHSCTDSCDCKSFVCGRDAGCCSELGSGASGATCTDDCDCASDFCASQGKCCVSPIGSGLFGATCATDCDCASQQCFQSSCL